MTTEDNSLAKWTMDKVYGLNAFFNDIDQIDALPLAEKEKNQRKLDKINYLDDLEGYYDTPYTYDPVTEPDIDDTTVLESINKLYTIVELEFAKHKFFQKVDLGYNRKKILKKIKLTAQKDVEKLLLNYYRDYRSHYDDENWKPNAPQIYGSVDRAKREDLYDNILNLMVIGGKSFTDQFHLGKIKKELDLIDWITEQTELTVDQSTDGPDEQEESDWGFDPAVSSMISIRSDIIEKLTLYISGFFDVPKEVIRKVLEGQKLPNQKLLFNENANRLIYIFAELKDNEHILENRTQINKWICDTFIYQKGPFIHSYVKRGLSKNENPPKDFIIKMPDFFKKKQVQ